MTFSILIFDEETQTFAGGTATGTICVGGWVLRADPRMGISATQGSQPSTIWGEDLLEYMGKGEPSNKAIETIINKDIHKEFRQVSTIDKHGNPGYFSGSENEPVIDQYINKNIVITGNTLKNTKVIKAILNGYKNSNNDLTKKIINALEKGHEAGGDRRGLKSAAILIVNNKKPPINLRIDYANNPINELKILYEKTCHNNYKNWLKSLPTRN